MPVAYGKNKVMALFIGIFSVCVSVMMMVLNYGICCVFPLFPHWVFQIFHTALDQIMGLEETGISMHTSQEDSQPLR